MKPSVRVDANLAAVEKVFHQIPMNYAGCVE